MPTTTRKQDRTGIRRRVAVFTTNVRNLENIRSVNPALAIRSWQSMRPGIETDHMLNADEKLSLIELGDRLTTPTV